MLEKDQLHTGVTKQTGIYAGKEGSTEKLLLHGAIGALTGTMSGGNALAGAVSGSVNEFALAYLSATKFKACLIRRAFLLVSLDCARHEHGTENHPLCGWKINGYTNKKITIRFI